LWIKNKEAGKNRGKREEKIKKIKL